MGGYLVNGLAAFSVVALGHTKSPWSTYWLFHDFGEDLENQDLPRIPLGPYGFSDAWRHDGGETADQDCQVAQPKT